VIAALALAGVAAVGRAQAAPPAGSSNSDDLTSGDEPRRALFALVIGVNSSPAPDVAPLQYADDDAARYLDLFRALGAHAVVLSRLDANTRRLHPQAAAEAIAPRRAELGRAVTALAREIAEARARGVAATLYVVYAGHGNVDDGEWALTLEDGRLTGAELLSEVVERAGAEATHVIVDACHAYMLATQRGPGGTRRPASGFVELEAASRAGRRVGYLLSSSPSGESHEWSGFEAGVFSHEVRSGLYGAADADGDGRVTYTEIGAFVSRANEAIVNDRFRSRVLARAPRGGDVLLDLRGRRDRGLRFEGADAGAHYLLEDSAGVRLLDFHGSPSTAVQLVRPAGEGPLYLRRPADGAERVVPRPDGVVRVSALPVTQTRAQTRGAAQHAFNQLFALEFDHDVVARWTRATTGAEARLEAAVRTQERDARRARERRFAGVAALGVGAAAALGAAAFELSARALYGSAPAGESQRDTMARNQQIESRNRAALSLGVGAAVIGAAGAVLLLWPRRPATLLDIDLAISGQGGGLSAGGRF
jgi:caspase domain-containing protein